MWISKFTKKLVLNASKPITVLQEMEENKIIPAYEILLLYRYIEPSLVTSKYKYYTKNNLSSDEEKQKLNFHFIHHLLDEFHTTCFNLIHTLSLKEEYKYLLLIEYDLTFNTELSKNLPFDVILKKLEKQSKFSDQKEIKILHEYFFVIYDLFRNKNITIIEGLKLEEIKNLCNAIFQNQTTIDFPPLLIERLKKVINSKNKIIDALNTEMDFFSILEVIKQSSGHFEILINTADNEFLIEVHDALITRIVINQGKFSSMEEKLKYILEYLLSNQTYRTTVTLTKKQSNNTHGISLNDILYFVVDIDEERH
ncbi:MAG: hypothetical protein N2505_00325 [Endomicrobia bacterium]|nr:hypothetical protein [Endomicrobiia bacterium]